MKKITKLEHADIVIRYLYHMIKRQDEKIRDIASELEYGKQKSQTYEVFDYKWNLDGNWSVQDDPEMYIPKVKSVNNILSLTSLQPGWFKGKRVLDAGCGNGKASYALCKLGAKVVSIDQSSEGIRRVRAFCSEFKDHKAYVHDLLTSIPDEDFDFIFSNGVIHHTGNTRLALKNLSDACKVGGKLFLMVYNYPISIGDFRHDLEFLEWHSKIESLDPPEMKKYLDRKKPHAVVRGWYDASGPKIEDHYSWGQMVKMLKSNNFGEIIRPNKKRHLYMLAKKIS